MKCSKNTVKWLICFIFCGMTAACSPAGSSDLGVTGNNQSSADKPSFDHYAQGAINGRAWRFVQGKATPFRRNNTQYLEIRLWNSEYTAPCFEPVGSTFQVRLYVAYDKGSWKIDPLDPFTLIPTIIFSDYTSGIHARGNLIADRGEITIMGLNQQTVMGQMTGSFSSARDVGPTQVDGGFEVPLCAP